MSIDFAALTLVPATRAQTIEARKRTYPQWGSGLTEDAYLQRDADLETHEHAVNGGVKTWCARLSSPTLFYTPADLHGQGPSAER